MVRKKKNTILNKTRHKCIFSVKLWTKTRIIEWQARILKIFVDRTNISIRFFPLKTWQAKTLSDISILRRQQKWKSSTISITLQASNYTQHIVNNLVFLALKQFPFLECKKWKFLGEKNMIWVRFYFVLHSKMGVSGFLR